MRPRVLVLLAAAAALVSALAGAGSTDRVSLTVTFSPAAGSARHVAHLRCTATAAGADGFLRAVGARRACATARRIERLLTSRPDPHRACTQIYSGPERALVTGTLGTRRVRHAFARTDGCKTADWRTAMPLLPRPG